MGKTTIYAKQTWDESGNVAGASLRLEILLADPAEIAETLRSVAELVETEALYSTTPPTQNYRLEMHQDPETGAWVKDLEKGDRRVADASQDDDHAWLTPEEFAD